MSDPTAIEGAQAALFAILSADETLAALPSIQIVRDEALPQQPVPAWLNVVIPENRPVRILAEVLGLGEDQVTVEFEATLHIEWIVHRDDDVLRRAAFSAGLKAIEDVLIGNRTLVVPHADGDPVNPPACRGCWLGVPDFANHVLAGVPKTSAALIPVLVLLKGRSTLG